MQLRVAGVARAKLPSALTMLLCVFCRLRRRVAGCNGSKPPSSGNRKWPVRTAYPGRGRTLPFAIPRRISPLALLFLLVDGKGFEPMCAAGCCTTGARECPQWNTGSKSPLLAGQRNDRPAGLAQSDGPVGSDTRPFQFDAGPDLHIDQSNPPVCGISNARTDP